MHSLDAANRSWNTFQENTVLNHTFSATLQVKTLRAITSHYLLISVSLKCFLLDSKPTQEFKLICIVMKDVENSQYLRAGKLEVRFYLERAVSLYLQIILTYSSGSGHYRINKYIWYWIFHQPIYLYKGKGCDMYPMPQILKIHPFKSEHSLQFHMLKWTVIIDDKLRI